MAAQAVIVAYRCKGWGRWSCLSLSCDDSILIYKNRLIFRAISSFDQRLLGGGLDNGHSSWFGLDGGRRGKIG
jgi:hypothetical protein